MGKKVKECGSALNFYRVWNERIYISNCLNEQKEKISKSYKEETGLRHRTGMKLGSCGGEVRLDRKKEKKGRMGAYR